MDYAARGTELLARAEKKSKGWSLFGGSKHEEAAELYEKAANQFKLAKAWQEAGETYVKLAEAHSKLESKHDTASAWVEAAKAFLKCDQRRGVYCLQQAVSLYTDMGRLGMAARQLREIAEVLEKEGAKEEALAFYEQIAQFAAELERYPQAIAIYEGVARTSVDNNLLKYSAKGYLLHAGICQLASADVTTIRTALERYKDIDISFDGSRECRLLETLADALESGDEEAFTSAVAEFDQLTRLDSWKTAMLLRVKRKLTSRGEDIEEEDLT
eukprot:scaffold2.g6953.t1